MQQLRNVFRRSVAAAAVAGLLAGSALLAQPAEAAEKVRVALGDVVSVETLAFLIALERAKDRGEHFDTRDATIPNAQTPPEIAAWQRRQRVAQYLVPLFAGANIVLNAYLTQHYRPGVTATGIARRLLPS